MDQRTKNKQVNTTNLQFSTSEKEIPHHDVEGCKMADRQVQPVGEICLILQEIRNGNRLSATINARYRLVHYHFLQQLYLTPVKIHKSKPEILDTCFRCGTEVHLHCTWTV